MGWIEETYPVPNRPLKVSCRRCEAPITGHSRGTVNPRSILKEVKWHMDSVHPPYDRSLVWDIQAAVEELNDGAPSPRRAGLFDLHHF